MNGISGNRPDLTVSHLLQELREIVNVVKGAIRNIVNCGELAADKNGCLKYRNELYTLQSDLWFVRGTLYELQESSVDVLLVSEGGKEAYGMLQKAFSNALNLLKSLQIGALAAFAHDMEASSLFDPAYSSVKEAHDVVNKSFKSFCDMSKAAERIIRSFNDCPFRLTYKVPEHLNDPDDAEADPQAIVTHGRILEPVSRELGSLWVTRKVGSAPYPTSRLRETQVELFEHLKLAIEPYGKSEPGMVLSVDATIVLLKGLQDSISKEVMRAKNQRFSIAFCGMVKAGKSLFLNSLTGKALLPSDELPATAWPCRLRHVKGQITPLLEVDDGYFVGPLEELRNCKIGAMMRDYVPPGQKTDLFASLLDDDCDSDDDDNGSVSTPAPEGDPKLAALYLQWVDLHPLTKANLLRFEDPRYHLQKTGSGANAVIDLLGQLNDIVRLCRRFKISMPAARPDSWPLLKVEFDTLRDQSIDGEFEFIDLPGVGEMNSDYYSFEDLVRTVAREVNTVIPILSFNEIAKGDWRKQLPAIVKTGLGRAPDFVLLTHLDQVAKNHVNDQIRNVAKEFWPKSLDFHRRVLCCSTRMGIGARALLQMSQVSKPRFADFWKENSILYDCAEKVLGVGDAKEKYAQLELEEWREALEHQLNNSRLRDAILQLTTGIVGSAQGRALKVEGEKLRRMVQRVVQEQQRQLLEITRSRTEFQHAYASFVDIRSKFQNFQATCLDETTKKKTSASAKLKNSFSILEFSGEAAALSAVDTAIERLSLRSDVARKKNKPSETVGKNELTFNSKTEAEAFFYLAQDELSSAMKDELTRKFVNFVRELAERSRVELFTTLIANLESAVSSKDAPQQDLLVDIIGKLLYQNQSVDTLFSSSLKSKIMRTDQQRYNAQTAYRSIRDAITKTILPSVSDKSVADDTASSSGLSQTDSAASGELGFMVRAPIAVLSAIPVVFGAFIWPFMVHSTKFVVDKKTLAKHLQEQILVPFFEALKSEAQTTIDTVIEKSSSTTQDIVLVTLHEEEERYNRELNHKQLSVEQTVAIAVSSIGLLWNFSAAEAGLGKLQTVFDTVINV